jgi:hypothetical protein
MKTSSKVGLVSAMLVAVASANLVAQNPYRDEEANHLFQSAKTGTPMEYARLEKQFVPGLLDDISAWIRTSPAK